MGSAAGEVSPFVCVVAIPDMKPDEWHVEKVQSLCPRYAAGHGFVYFAHNRCGTEAMWKDYFERVAVPTIKESNALHQCKDDDNNAMRIFFSTDGEGTSLLLLLNYYRLKYDSSAYTERGVLCYLLFYAIQY